MILPISVRVGDDLFVDVRDPERVLEFYQRHAIDKSRDAATIPFSVDQIKQLFLDRVVIDYDYAIVQTIAQSRSPIFANATEASLAILREYKPVRKRAGIEGPFALRVIDSQTLFAGQAALAAETVRLIRAGTKINEIRQQVEALASKSYGYATFPDLYYVRERARKKGDKSVGWLSAVMGSALDIKPILCGSEDQTFPVAKVRGYDHAVERVFANAARRVESGLLAPVVCISYAGDVAQIKKLPGYEQLLSAARTANVEVLEAMMSITGGVNLGPGALTVGFIAEPQEFV